MIVALLTIFSTMMIFRWAGLQLVDRQRAFENSSVDGDSSVETQYFHDPIRMNAVFDAR